MVAVTKQDITNVAPEFSGVEETTVDLFIEYARQFVAEGQWKSKAKQGIVWMACHMMKTVGLGSGGSSGTGTSGPMTSEKVGDLQRSYGQLSLQGGTALDQVLAQTKYGQMFIMIRKTIFTTPLVV